MKFLSRSWSRRGELSWGRGDEGTYSWGIGTLLSLRASQHIHRRPGLQPVRQYIMSGSVCRDGALMYKDAVSFGQSTL